MCLGSFWVLAQLHGSVMASKFSQLLRLEVCTDGTCRGVLDTGTSHLGVPAPYDKDTEASDATQDLFVICESLRPCPYLHSLVANMDQ